MNAQTDQQNNMIHYKSCQLVAIGCLFISGFCQPMQSQYVQLASSLIAKFQTTALFEMFGNFLKFQGTLRVVFA